jgi:hypothetical protein
VKAYPLKFANGEVGELRQLDNSMFAYPICGEPWLYPPYCPNDGVLGPARPVSAPALGDVCEGCEVEFGVDEGVVPDAPAGWMRRQFIGFRIDGWTA